MAEESAHRRRSPYESLQKTGRRADTTRMRLSELNVNEMLTFAMIGGVALIVIARILLRN